ncbi:unnamed protein product [Amoebophrya sp. A120]|nr:unnamed protein product [Amoebophrya sp. A120]|eukprot:GSA120T00006256001.1
MGVYYQQPGSSRTKLLMQTRYLLTLLVTRIHSYAKGTELSSHLHYTRDLNAGEAFFTSFFASRKIHKNFVSFTEPGVPFQQQRIENSYRASVQRDDSSAGSFRNIDSLLVVSPGFVPGSPSDCRPTFPF